MAMEITVAEAEAYITAVPQLQADMETLKNSVSEGKALIAEAVTDKGVETASDATFATMAENIALIETSSTNSSFYEQLGTSTKTMEIDATKTYYIVSFCFRSTSYYACGAWKIVSGTLSQIKLNYGNSYNAYITPKLSGTTLTIPASYSTAYPTFFAFVEASE